jgi:AraC-like DNA-binding protein
VNAKSYPLSPGFALLLHPQDSVKGLKDSELSLCNIALHFNVEAGLNTTGDLQRFHERPTQLRNLAVIYELMRYLSPLLRMEDSDTKIECDLIGRQIVNIFMRQWEMEPEDIVDGRIREQSERMRNHPNRGGSVSQMAQEVGLSASQFTRRFARLFRTSPNAFLIQTRIEQARSLLLESTLTISEISDLLGYSDVSFFSKQFKAMTGLSPRVFRQGRPGDSHLRQGYGGQESPPGYFGSSGISSSCGRAMTWAAMSLPVSR